MVKTQKDVKTLGLSYAEACVVHTHTILVPGIFGEATDCPSGSALSGLPNYEAWKNMTKFTGLAYVIKQSLAQVSHEIADIIQEEFTNHRTLFELHTTASRIALNSQAFLTHLIHWVDDTYNHLIASGNTKDSVWWVITSVLKEIFREYMASARSTPTDINFDDHIHWASTCIWGAVRTDTATANLSKKCIRNHPSVVGAYSQWLVTNNGLKEALQARNESKKVEALVASLKSTVVE